MKKYLFLLFLVCSIAQAEWKQLECVYENGFTVYIDFDSQKQLAKSGTELIVPANITEQLIYFKMTFPDGNTWIHTINRSSGVLLVKKDSPDGVFSKPYACSPFQSAKRKF